MYWMRRWWFCGRPNHRRFSRRVTWRCKPDSHAALHENFQQRIISTCIAPIPDLDVSLVKPYPEEDNYALILFDLSFSSQIRIKNESQKTFFTKWYLCAKAITHRWMYGFCKAKIYSFLHFFPMVFCKAKIRCTEIWTEEMPSSKSGGGVTGCLLDTVIFIFVIVHYFILLYISYPICCNCI